MERRALRSPPGRRRRPRSNRQPLRCPKRHRWWRHPLHRAGRGSDVDPSVTVEFTAPRDGVFGLALDGAIAVSADQAGVQPLLVITALGRAVVIKNPVVDFQNLVITPDLADEVEEVPADYLASFAQRPG